MRNKPSTTKRMTVGSIMKPMMKRKEALKRAKGRVRKRSG